MINAGCINYDKMQPADLMRWTHSQSNRVF